MTDEQKKTEGTEEVVPKTDYLRLAADFENYRKRMEGPGGALAGAMHTGKELVITDILDLLDALESAKAQEEWTEGLELAVGTFMQALTRHGVDRIDTDAKDFDPVTMEAVGTAPASPAGGHGGKANTVQSEQRAGWTMHDRVIRPARVVVYQ